MTRALEPCRRLTFDWDLNGHTSLLIPLPPPHLAHGQRDPELLKGLFVRVYLDRVFPLLHSARLPEPQWADEEREGRRWAVIFGGTERDSAQGDAGLATLLAVDAVQEAFDVTQVTYDFLASARRGVAIT